MKTSCKLKHPFQAQLCRHSTAIGTLVQCHYIAAQQLALLQHILITLLLQAPGIHPLDLSSAFQTFRVLSPCCLQELGAWCLLPQTLCVLPKLTQRVMVLHFETNIRAPYSCTACVCFYLAHWSHPCFALHAG